MTRRWLIAVAVGGYLLLAGVGVWWWWPSDRHVAPGTVQASVLTADEASTAVGTTLVSEQSASEPPPALTTDPAGCAVAAGPATDEVYTRGWTTFGSVTYQDSEAVSDHTVIQVLGVYPDEERSRQVFGDLADGLKGCRSAVRTSGDQRVSAWTYSIDAATADALGWTATENTGDGWACYRQARLKRTAVLQVGVCQAGDGKQAATAIADRFAARVGG
ncbi:sensor domain-containing protein [Lentzea sp. NPDC051838]|uniref:sensor domain-containing protein n=1 Tax=Lentzea sp. NPDC051838 TaxID=3154849 RepID=UPI003430B8FF